MPAPKRDAVFAVAAVHAFLASFPSFVQSVLGLMTEEDPFAQWALTEESLHILVSTGIGKLYLEMCTLFISMMAFGYYRIYLDGPERQPLALCFGTIGKLCVAALFVRAYWQGYCKEGALVAATIPDSLFGLYFLRTWAKLNFALVVSDASSPEKND